MVEKYLSERDIFLDYEVMELLLRIKECKHPGMYTLLTPDFDKKIAVCLNKHQKSLSNVYASSDYVETKETIKKIVDMATLSNYKCSFEVFASAASSSENYSLGRKATEGCAIVDVQNYDIKMIRKGHRLNIKRAQTMGATATIYHGVSLDERVLKDFYDSVLYSRKILGKNFTHTYSTFEFRNQLIQKGKAALVVVEHEEKKSYVFSLLSKYNSFYYDSGYTSELHPYTAHYAQHVLIQYLKDLGATSYNLGAIASNKNASNTSDNRNSNVEYYKVGFCTSLTRTETIT